MQCENETSEKENMQYTQTADSSLDTITKLTMENESKQIIIENLQKLRKKDLEDLQSYHIELMRLKNENELLNKEVADLRNQLNQAIPNYKELDLKAFKKVVNATEMSQKSVILKSNLTQEVACCSTTGTVINDVQPSDIEASSLNFRVNNLPTPCRPDSLSSDHSLLDHTNEVNSELEITGSDNEDDNSSLATVDYENHRGVKQLGAGDTISSPSQLSLLLSERQVLTTRLEAMRVHLAEVKAEWSDCIVSLEHEVSTLNMKIIQDSENYNKLQSILKETIDDQKQQIEYLKRALKSAVEQSSNSQMELINLKMIHGQKTREWQTERNTLITQVQNALDQAKLPKQDSCKHSELSV
ncbi:unnamed protein product [Trichobilharzia szidati]|nr:unnamed protein product [Trichobilharzia szidati]